MPTISIFYGIIIRMYFAPEEHNPPHFHAYYQGKKAIVGINDCEVIKSNFPKKQNKMITAWAEMHQDELSANWEICQNGGNPYQIQPLI
jgi:hypothetical protein